MAVSSSKIVATGERGELPAIHIWDSQSLKNISIIKGTHQKGVGLLQFFKNDQFLVSCGVRNSTQILIFNVQTQEVVLSTYIENDYICNILPFLMLSQ